MEHGEYNAAHIQNRYERQRYLRKDIPGKRAKHRRPVYPSIELTKDGGYIANVSELIPNSSPRLVKMNSNGTVGWVRNYTPRPSQMLFRSFEDTSGYVTTGEIRKQAGGSKDIILIKTNLSGLMGSGDNSNCPVTSSPAVDNNIQATIYVCPIHILGLRWVTVTCKR